MPKVTCIKRIKRVIFIHEIQNETIKNDRQTYCQSCEKPV